MEQPAFEHRQTQIVRTFHTRAEADLLAMTLIAHGIQAHVYETGSQHPSLDWVEGMKVVVAADDLQRALKLLAGLEGTTTG
ncbi:MAG: hypothetical protein M3O70_01655 [Actinomycetota bacterium]|nr:hypothetical protein [Actinomycetota bacterium]